MLFTGKRPSLGKNWPHVSGSSAALAKVALSFCHCLGAAGVLAWPAGGCVITLAGSKLCRLEHGIKAHLQIQALQ